MSWQELASLLASFGALLGVLINVVNIRRANKSLDVKDDVSLSSLYREVLNDVDGLRDKLKIANDAYDGLEEKLTSAENHEKDCRHRLERLENILPFSLLSDRIDDLASVSDIFDRCSDGIVITSPTSGGTFLWVNLAFALSLGMTRDEVLKTSWVSIIHPDDRQRTEEAESQAWITPLEGFVNRLVGKSGRANVYKWFTSQYKKGISFSVVKIRPPLNIEEIESV